MPHPLGPEEPAELPGQSPALQGPLQTAWVLEGIGGRLGRSGEASGKSRRGVEGDYPTHSSPGSLLGSQVACRILVHKPGVGSKLLWWELQVQSTGLTENLRPQGIFIGVRSHRVPRLSTKTQLCPIAYKPQCWTPQAKQPVRQEHNPTHKKN